MSFANPAIFLGSICKVRNLAVPYLRGKVEKKRSVAISGDGHDAVWFLPRSLARLNRYRDPHLTYILASESTDTRTGLEESEGKEDLLVTSGND